MDKRINTSLVVNRRNALRIGVTVAVGAVVLPSPFLSAAEPVDKPLPALELTNPAAKALGYVEDATKVDAAKFKQYKVGNICDNCKLIQGKVGQARRPCQLFPGKSVAAKGWCSGWVKMA